MTGDRQTDRPASRRPPEDKDAALFTVPPLLVGAVAAPPALPPQTPLPDSDNRDVHAPRDSNGLKGVLAPGEDTSHLFEPGSNRSLGSYLKRTWALRFYLRAEAAGNVGRTSSQTVLGGAWLLLSPMLQAFVWFLLFGVGLRGGDRTPGTDFLSYLLVGFTMYEIFSKFVLKSAGSVRANGASMSLDFPKLMMPLSKMLQTLLEFRYTLASTVLILLIKREWPNLRWLMLLVILVGVVGLSAGVGFLVARAAVHLPDLKDFLATPVRILYLASGIFLPIEAFILERDSGETLLSLYTIANPVFAAVKLAQWSLLDYDVVPVGLAALSLSVWAILLLPVGLLWFIRGESEYREASGRAVQ